MDIIDKIVSLHNKNFSKSEVLATLYLFCNQTFKLTTICYVFKSIKLVFFNFNVVFNKICEK